MSVPPELWEAVLSCLYNLGFAWSAASFLRRQLKGTGTEALVFGLLFFCSSMWMQVVLEGRGVSYMIRAQIWNLVLAGLTLLIFCPVPQNPAKPQSLEQPSKLQNPAQSPKLQSLARSAGYILGSPERVLKDWERKVLAAVVLAVIIRLVGNFTESFLTCLGLVLVHAISGASRVGRRGYGLILCGTYGITVTAVCLLSGLLERVFAGKRDKWYLYLAIPLMLVLLLNDLANWAASNGIMFQDWGKYGLLENQLFSHGAICVLTGLSMGAAGFFVLGMNRIHEEAKAKEQYQTQVLYYQMLKEQYRSMESLRHDMKNHLIALGGFVRNRQWEPAERYLDNLARAGGMEGGEAVTGNPAVDALFYHKGKQAERLGILWQWDVCVLPSPCPVRDLDLCIILGNILDNALEACQRMQGEEKKAPFIRLHMAMVKRCLLLEVKNSASKEHPPVMEGLDCQGRGPWRTSKKENPGEHGLGLSNVREAVEHYDGAIRIEAEEPTGVVTVSVLLPLSGISETVCRHNDSLPDRSSDRPFGTFL